MDGQSDLLTRHAACWEFTHTWVVTLDIAILENDGSIFVL